MHVGFNGQWKEGLSELSGGQRSLVALSLVLAMLQFKPAPIYILDEVRYIFFPNLKEIKTDINLKYGHLKDIYFRWTLPWILRTQRTSVNW